MRLLLVLTAASALAPPSTKHTSWSSTKRAGIWSAGRVVAVRSSSYDVEGGAESSAPYDIEEPAPAEPTKDVAALKSKLFAACAAADRGFAASPADREEIEALLDELSPLSPIEEPTRGIAEGAADAPLRKCWRLVYTSASDVSTLAANPLASLGGIYQDARELPVVVNVIDSFPRLLANLPPDAASKLATTTRLRVQTRARPRSATRVGLSFESVGAEQLAVLGQAVPDWLPKPKVDLPQLGLDVQRRIFSVGDDEDPRDAASNPAFFDVQFLDEELLVIKQGSPGGLFAAVAVDELAKGY
mmetsp:Transcript_16108/g.42472  ORF Transcript_16108/g.42472 Transcript_16108/m.42472 type:complete len:302 (-) Transcript_16108:27-932(-)